MTNHALRSIGKAREQPRQRDLDAHTGLIDIDEAGGHLAQSRRPERQAVAGPYVLVDRDQPGEFALGTAEPILDPAQRLVLSEAMRDDHHERF